MRNLASPFKFNLEWLKEDSFIELVKWQWIPIDFDSGEAITVQFVANLKKVKRTIKAWESQKCARDEKDLLDTKVALKSIYESAARGYETQESKDILIQLEQKRRKILDDKEAT